MTFLWVGVGVLPQGMAQVKEAAKIPNSIIVIFQSQTLLSDAAQHIFQAGGKVVSSLDAVGVVVAAPNTVDGPTLIANLTKDNAVLDVDYDRVFDLIAPTQMWTDDDVGGQTHFPHPLPTFSPALPADFFYTSSPPRVGSEARRGAGWRNPGWWVWRMGRNQRRWCHHRDSRYWRESRPS